MFLLGYKKYNVMKLIKPNGLIDLGKVGKFLSNLKREEHIQLAPMLRRSGTNFDTLVPALEYFHQLGHLEINLTQKTIFIYEERKEPKDLGIFMSSPNELNGN